jgi:hypothetical protein
MEPVIKEKKWGGARKGAGKKKGTLWKTTVDGKVALDRFRQRTFRIVDKLFNAQLVEALGYHKMVVTRIVGGAVVQIDVKDPKQMENLLATGEEGKDYRIVVASEPNHKASQAILDRAFGRATEVHEISGKDGQPFIVKLDN